MSHRSNVEAGNAWAFVAVLLLVLLIGGCAMPTLPDTGSVAEAKTPLRVTIFPYLSFSPLYIAQEEGYFSAEGLDVEFVRFQRNSESLTALLRGEVDVDSIFTVGLHSTPLPAPARMSALWQTKKCLPRAAARQTDL
ncbi:MAG: ABC transporter substrate-binding protein [Caldilineaceae bacterium]